MLTFGISFFEYQNYSSWQKCLKSTTYVAKVLSELKFLCKTAKQSMIQLQIENLIAILISLCLNRLNIIKILE